MSSVNGLFKQFLRASQSRIKINSEYEYITHIVKNNMDVP